MKREHIPNDVKRRVLIEAGHRCAIPTCRSAVSVDIHHIKPVHEGGDNSPDNLIPLCPNCHRMVHDGKIDRKSVAIYKRNLRFTYDRFTQVEADLLFEMHKAPDGYEFAWNETMLLLLKRLFDAGFIIARRAGANMILDGISMGPVLLQMTEKGRTYMKEVSSSSEEASHILY